MGNRFEVIMRVHAQTDKTKIFKTIIFQICTQKANKTEISISLSYLKFSFNDFVPLHAVKYFFLN